MIEVDRDDPAFDDPTKPIGPLYGDEEAAALAAEKGWDVQAATATSIRRVVASPQPKRIFEIEPIEWLLENGCVVICAGGGGIPTMYADEPVPAGRRLVGVEAVIDKDLASALLASDLGADVLAIVTDVDAVYAGWGTPEQQAIRRATPRGARDDGVRRRLDGAEGPRRVPRSSSRPVGSRPSARSPIPTRSSAARPGRSSRADAAGLELAGVS